MDDDCEGEGQVIELANDPIAERLAQIRLTGLAADKVKNKKIQDEMIMSMRRVRMSFGAMSEAQVVPIHGGKEAKDKTIL